MKMDVDAEIAKLRLRERILYWWHAGERNYHRLMDRCFPHEFYPRAFRSSSNGGPPGCAMAFGNALRLLGIDRARDGRLWMNAEP